MQIEAIENVADYQSEHEKGEMDPPPAVGNLGFLDGRGVLGTFSRWDYGAIYVGAVTPSLWVAT